MDQTTEFSPRTEVELEQKTTESWIKELFQKGYQRLESPSSPDKKFILAARHNKKTGPQRRFGKDVIFQHSDWDGVNEVFALDLFEEIGEGNKVRYEVVGHRDYRIGRMHDGTVANGNRGARVIELTTAFSREQLQDSLLETMSSKHIFSKVDKQGYLNGIDVEEKYRHMGFGRLLTAVGLAGLREIGVEEIDFNGKLSSKFKPLMIELGYNAALGEKPPHRQLLKDFSTPKITEFINPFILK